MQENRENLLINTNDLLKEKFENIVINEKNVSSYSSAIKEYELLKHGTGIRILNSKAFLKLEGTDSLEFLHRISSNDLKSLEIYRMKNTLFTNEKGRVLDDAKIVNNEQNILVIGSENNSKVLESWLNKFIIMEDITVTDMTNDFVFLEFFGSQSEVFLMMLAGKVITETAENNFRTIDFFDKQVKFFKSEFFENYSKYSLVIKNEDFTEILDSILKTETVFDFGFIGEEAYEIFRIENLIPRFPNEINDNFNPHEINLINAVSFSKGCYIGQEVIARLETYDKVQRILKKVCITENVSVDDLPLQIINSEEEESGLITSFINSEFLKKKIGLALIRKKNIDEDLFFSIDKQKVQLKIK